MADIFISYSKADHALALKLSAFLEAEGWSVWWDKSLGAADLYRDEIMKQLAAARAVISIWTPNSIRSDWVRAEAGAAKKDGKLIPVKTPDVAYADIPLPFGEMHTENAGSTELIRAAVVAQLAKPAVEPTAWTLLTKDFKWELLTWWGIIGGAITLFAALSATLKLAEWARLLVDHWKDWTHAFWVLAFGWLGIHVPLEWLPVLSFALFGSLLAIGQIIRYKNAIRGQPIVDNYHGRSFRLISWRTLFYVVVILVVAHLGYDLFGTKGIWLLGVSAHWPESLAWRNEIVVVLFIVVQVIFVLLARYKLYAAISVFLIGIFSIIIVFTPLISIWNERMPGRPDSSDISDVHISDVQIVVQNLLFGRVGPPQSDQIPSVSGIGEVIQALNQREEAWRRLRDAVETRRMSAFDPIIVAVLIAWVLPLIVFSVAPAKAVTRRLLFLAIGLLLLIALNELSKLGLDVTAPKLQG
jgi:hypothetical protein